MRLSHSVWKKRKSRHSSRSHRVGNIESLLGAPAQIYIKDLYSRYFDGKYDRDLGQPPRIRKITALSKRTGIYRNAPVALKKQKSHHSLRSYIVGNKEAWIPFIPAYDCTHFSSK